MDGVLFVYCLGAFFGFGFCMKGSWQGHGDLSLKKINQVNIYSQRSSISSLSLSRSGKGSSVPSQNKTMA